MINNLDESSKRLGRLQEINSAALNNEKVAKTGAVFVNKTSVDFDKTDIDDECFRLIKITQEGESAPVNLYSDSPDVFQIAIGVKKLVFEDELTFTPGEGGTFVHIRFSPNRTGHYTGNLVLKSGEGQQTVTLNGRGGSYIAAPASEQLKGLSPLLKWAAILVVLGGVGYTGYTYKCQLIPSLCDQANDIQQVNNEPSDNLPVPAATSQEAKVETIEPATKVSAEPVVKPSARVNKVQTQNGKDQTTVRNEKNTEQKAVNTTRSSQTQKSKPAQKAPASEESDLELELNKKPGV